MNNDEKSTLPQGAESLPQTLGFGTVEPGPDFLQQACALASEVGNRVAAMLPPTLSWRDKSKVLRAFKSNLAPSKKPGRKPRALVCPSGKAA
jgi:hypothetical protein